MRWLLTEAEESLSQVGFAACNRVWYGLSLQKQTSDAVELSSLLKVIVMIEEASADFVARLSPKHAEFCERGRQFRAQLPSYLGQQRAAIVADCPLPDVLQSLVVSYAATTSEDMWSNGLRVKVPKAKRPRYGGRA
jgi:hypothetical protein